MPKNRIARAGAVLEELSVADQVVAEGLDARGSAGSDVVHRRAARRKALSDLLTLISESPHMGAHECREGEHYEPGDCPIVRAAMVYTDELLVYDPPRYSDMP